MKTEQKEDKVVYTLRQQKNNYGTNKLGLINFSSPDSDGNKLKKAMEQLKDKEIVTVTIEVKEIKPTVEYLSNNGTWTKSGNPQTDIDKYTPFGKDSKYTYSYHFNLLYRTKLEE